MPQMSPVNSRCTARPGTNRPSLSNAAAISALPTGKKMKISSSTAITTTMAATVGSPTKRPRRATARAKQMVSAISATDAPAPKETPAGPAAKPAANVQTTANAAAAAVPRSNPRHAHNSAHDRRDEGGPERCGARQRPQQRGRAAAQRPRQHRERRQRNRGDHDVGAIARRRHEDGCRRRDRGHRLPGYLGSVETSVSHFVNRRLRSADEPYLTKS